MTKDNPALLAIDPLTKALPQQPSIKVENEISQSSTVKSDLDLPISQSHPLYLVVHPDVSRASKVRAVADWLIKTLSTIDPAS